MEHKVGIIGLGVVGKRMLANMTAHHRFTVVGAWDSNPEACAETRARHPYLRIGDSAEAVIVNPDVELIYIAVPPLAHRRYALATIAAGRAVFCEKPLGINIGESRDLLQRVVESGRPNAVNFVYGATAASDLLESKLREGALGTIQGVDIRLHFATWPRLWQQSATWLSTREQGGFVREVLSHFIYLVERLFGQAEIRHAATRFPPGGELAETHVLAELACKGLCVTIAGSVGGAGPDQVEFTVWGSRQSYRLREWYRLTVSEGGDFADALPPIADLAQDAYQRQLDNLAALLDGGAHAMPDFAAALSVQQIIEALLWT